MIKYSITRVCLWLTIVCFVSNFEAQCAPEQSPSVNAAAVDAVVLKEMKDQKIVGLAIAIIGKGEVLYSKGYGYADLENPTPVSTKTVFNWASNSKPVMAIAAMQLVEAGELDLDASVSDYESNKRGQEPSLENR